MDEGLAEALASGWRGADLSPRLRAVFEYAAKLTGSPASVEREDVEGLREAGLGDGEVLAVAQVASYFNFVNRMAEGLGVELEG